MNDSLCMVASCVLGGRHLPRNSHDNMRSRSTNPMFHLRSKASADSAQRSLADEHGKPPNGTHVEKPSGANVWECPCNTNVAPWHDVGRHSKMGREIDILGVDTKSARICYYLDIACCVLYHYASRVFMDVSAKSALVD